MGIYLEYLKYVLRHKWYVGRECFRRGLYWRGLKHDWSKFLPSEFIAYARYFYGGPYKPIMETHGDERNETLNGLYKERVEEDFNAAWNHHQKRNSHHWQYWVLMNDNGSVEALPMPVADLIEMLCDWMGAGAAINRSQPSLAETREWYAKNAEKMQLHPITRLWIERAIELYKAAANG